MKCWGGGGVQCIIEGQQHFYFSSHIIRMIKSIDFEGQGAWSLHGEDWKCSEDNIKVELGEIGMEDVDWIHVAQEINQWGLLWTQTRGSIQGGVFDNLWILFACQGLSFMEFLGECNLHLLLSLTNILTLPHSSSWAYYLLLKESAP
jgi:hypothetical protein